MLSVHACMLGCLLCVETPTLQHSHTRTRTHHAHDFEFFWKILLDVLLNVNVNDVTDGGAGVPHSQPRRRAWLTRLCAAAARDPWIDSATILLVLLLVLLLVVVDDRERGRGADVAEVLEHLAVQLRLIGQERMRPRATVDEHSVHPKAAHSVRWVVERTALCKAQHHLCHVWGEGDDVFAWRLREWRACAATAAAAGTTAATCTAGIA